MGYDISADLAGEIGKAKVFGNSDNIRHGRYKFLIRRIFAEKVQTGRFAFAEFTVLEASPNPVPPDFMPECRDDGMHPNMVGSTCAMKINFDGPGGVSAASNVKAFVLGLFGKKDGEISDAEVSATWTELARQVAGVFDGKPKEANPGCGMVISCHTSAKEKKKTKLLPKMQKEYVTVLNWDCVAVPGMGENSKELVAKRRTEIESQTPQVDDEADVVSTSYQKTQESTAVAPPIPPTPPTAPQSWTPPAPWRAHPSSPGWYWDGGNGVKNEAQLRAMS